MAQLCQVEVIQTGPVLREGLGAVPLHLPARKCAAGGLTHKYSCESETKCPGKCSDARADGDSRNPITPRARDSHSFINKLRYDLFARTGLQIYEVPTIRLLCD